MRSPLTLTPGQAGRPSAINPWRGPVGGNHAPTTLGAAVRAGTLGRERRQGSLGRAVPYATSLTQAGALRPIQAALPSRRGPLREEPRWARPSVGNSTAATAGTSRLDETLGKSPPLAERSGRRPHAACDRQPLECSAASRTRLPHVRVRAPPGALRSQRPARPARADAAADARSHVDPLLSGFELLEAER